MSEESNGESNSGSSRNLVLPGDLLKTKSKPGKGIFSNFFYPFSFDIFQNNV